jgi:hypothetical protein
MVPSGTRLLSSVKAYCRHLSKVGTTCTPASHPLCSAAITYHTSATSLMDSARAGRTERDNSCRAKAGPPTIDNDSAANRPILDRGSYAE